MKEFYLKAREGRSIYVHHIHFKRDMNNNKMKMMNDEIRDREKVMKGLKSDTPILKEYEIFHNYLRLHMGLDGQTSAEKCGIKIEGSNKWITLIQNAKIVHENLRLQDLGEIMLNESRVIIKDNKVFTPWDIVSFLEQEL